MRHLDSGFLIGDERFAWGSLIADVQVRLAAASVHCSKHNDTRLEAKCGTVFEFSAIGIELSAPRSDRPVTELCYQLASASGTGNPSPEMFTAPIIAALGQPREASEYALSEDGDPSGSVRYYAAWESGDHSVGLSLYGAPRQTSFGTAPGCLWVSWSVTAAAQPFIAKWRENAAELAGLTETEIAGFQLRAEQRPVFGESGRLSAEAARHRDASYALMQPELLPTPKLISALVGKQGFAFWRSEENGNWFASTAWDTIRFAGEIRDGINWNDIEPAKGGGFSELTIGRWCVRDYARSQVIPGAVAALEKIAGVRVNRHTGYDC